MNMQQISDWAGASGGTRDNPPELLAKCKYNFELVDKGLHRGRYCGIFEDFLGDVVPDQMNAILGNGGATAAAISAAKNGVLLLTSDDTAGSVAADGAGVNFELNWYAENDELVMETRLKISAITTVSLFVGFTDTKALEAAVISAGSADTITTNATDAVGFMFDTSMTTDNLWAVGVANDVDATKQNLSVAPVADTYITLRVQVTAAGVATFYINGTQVGAAMESAVRPTIALTPQILIWPRTTAVRTCSVDYIAVSQKR